MSNRDKIILAKFNKCCKKEKFYGSIFPKFFTFFFIRNAPFYCSSGLSIYRVKNIYVVCCKFPSNLISMTLFVM